MLRIWMRVIGHELVQAKAEDGTQYDMLKVKFRGLGDDGKSVACAMVDPVRMADYRIGAKYELSFDARQTELPLGVANVS